MKDQSNRNSKDSDKWQMPLGSRKPRKAPKGIQPRAGDSLDEELKRGKERLPKNTLDNTPHGKGSDWQFGRDPEDGSLQSSI